MREIRFMQGSFLTIQTARRVCPLAALAICLISVAAWADSWSFLPLQRPSIPSLAPDDQQRTRNPIDAFILSKLREQNLQPSAEADRRTLIRRVYFDLVGLPPEPRDVQAFLADPDPNAYEKLVDRLLGSPRYGERWARHWLDVVHYGDSHGYDKDQPRPNAWPYRDYVIRAFNNDKPYSRFVREQIAGDALYPHDSEAILATGFIAAGPWDAIAHLEVPETKIDGMIARHLDRDDMVANTMNTFVSLTVQCAQCHDHKFDPIPQKDYYRLQAVFAALDRADRPYDDAPEIAKRRIQLTADRTRLTEKKQAIEQQIAARGGSELADLDKQIQALRQQSAKQRPEFGYHSQIESSPDHSKWVQVDLGKPVALDRIVLVGCDDDFNGIGPGFGFPVRFKVELSNDPAFAAEATPVLDHTESDYTNPETNPQTVRINGKTARYIRVTATKLAPRKDDYIFALAELSAFDATGHNVALGAAVTAFDSIEAPPRWQKQNLVDGYYPGLKLPADESLLADLQNKRRALLDRLVGTELQSQLAEIQNQLAAVNAQLDQLPKPKLVFAGTVHFGSGNFRGTGPDGGKPRPVRLLRRGSVLEPGDLVAPAALSAVSTVESEFALPNDHSEGQRRIALADWITDPRNPFTWRSIVNRVWHYHFGRGIVDSPNDFGRMGEMPTHPELLDWLAVEFRDTGQSFKKLHRLIVTSATYRQSSASNPKHAAVDAANQYLWRANRRRLEAEAIRDSILFVSGKLDLKMHGPGFQDFIVEKPEHSPHYQYHLHDPEDPRSHRRAVYRFIVRSQQQPFMNTLDCADPSMQVEKRNETLTALQALTLLNNKLVVSMSQHFARRIESNDLAASIDTAFWLALSRAPAPEERQLMIDYAREHGLANACRLLFNANEFIFVD